MRDEVGVVIARFQVPELHSAHVNLLKHVAGKHGRIVVMLGVSSVPGTTLYPLDFVTRQHMVRQHMPDATVYPLPDMPNDKDWSRNVDSVLHRLYPTASFVLYGGVDSFINHYHGRNETEIVDARGSTSAGTVIRAEVGRQPIDSSTFRAGVIYSTQNRFPTMHSVVDIAVVRHALGCSSDKPCGLEVLMGRKKHEASEGKIVEPQDFVKMTTEEFHDFTETVIASGARQPCRFIGGFVDKADEGLEKACYRELTEETGLLPTHLTSFEYVGSVNIDDWRYRRTRDGVMTTMFYCVMLSSRTKTSPEDG